MKDVLDLRKGVCETSQYNAWRFPAGELHVKLHNTMLSKNGTEIVTNMSSSDDIILLLIIVDLLRKIDNRHNISLLITYMAYQQADRDFGRSECFSLKTIANLINSANLDEVRVFDCHSDVAPALINNCTVIQNYMFIDTVFADLGGTSDLVVLSPDAGAYKKIFKLCHALGFKGQIECCSKSRDHNTGAITIKVPEFDSTKRVLIIDDICLGGRTFVAIKSQIKNPTYLAVSHGIFNEGVDHLEWCFEKIYTTDSRCSMKESDKLSIFNIYGL